jgi:hypothetical protein
MNKPEQVDHLADTQVLPDDKPSKVTSDDETVRFRRPSIEELEARAREKTPKD